MAYYNTGMNAYSQLGQSVTGANYYNPMTTAAMAYNPMAAATGMVSTDTYSKGFYDGMAAAAVRNSGYNNGYYGGVPYMASSYPSYAYPQGYAAPGAYGYPTVYGGNFASRSSMYDDNAYQNGLGSYQARNSRSRKGSRRYNNQRNKGLFGSDEESTSSENDDLNPDMGYPAGYYPAGTYPLGTASDRYSDQTLQGDRRSQSVSSTYGQTYGYDAQGRRYPRKKNQQKSCC